ncbi:MAG: cyclic nucleotide-binding/CBS domain-containing protein [Candidatus Bathyarchaeia archaeon]
MSGLLLVRDAMSQNVKTVKVDDTVLDAVRKMNKFRIGSVVVLSGTRPVGIITERNILQRVVEPCADPRVIKAKDIMSSPLITIESNVPLEEAARLMVRRGIKKLPVIDDGRLVGIITTTDLVRASPVQLGIIEELLKVSPK